MSHALAVVRHGGRRPPVTQRGFPRAGGRGVGAGKKEVDGVPPLESPAGAPKAREGAHRRDRGMLAFRGHDGERP